MGNLKIPRGREKCRTPVADKKIPFSGKRTSTLYLLNPSERSVEKVQVDGCAITDGTCCDWAVEVNDHVSREEIFIELKGSHITIAVKQIEATITRLSSNPAQTKKRCLVVFKKDTVTKRWFQQQQRKFQQDYKADLLRLRHGESHSLEPAK
jgi:hypothetical protein